MVNVLFVAAEAAPFAKTGGLGDVVASLPKELRRQGIDARVILPKHNSISEELKARMVTQITCRVPLSWRIQQCTLEKLVYDGVPFYFIDNEYYFKRSGLYGHYDDAERYAFFSRAVLEILPYMDFQPDILHCHDWHSAMVSVFLTAHYRANPVYEKIKTLYTVHNLKYQGIFPKDIMVNLLDLGWEYFTVNGLEFYDKVNFMKGGLVFSDLISTVSPTYANEIQYAYFGENLEGVLSSRSCDLFGILNGIDYTVYNPSIDTSLFATYDWQTKERKTINKIELQKMLGLPVAADKPLLAMSSRMIEAKGFSLVIRIINYLLASDVQLVILGQGDEYYQQLFWQAAWLYTDRLATVIPYDEDMAHKLYAASDLFLMPSRYEPCGTSQLIAMRYGSLPVVRETGGLNDTVVSYNEYTDQGNGFSFTNYNAHDFLHTVRRAIGFYYKKDVWNRLVVRAMETDNSWQASAAKYRSLYDKLQVDALTNKQDLVRTVVSPDYSVPASNAIIGQQIIPAREGLYVH